MSLAAERVQTFLGAITEALGFADGGDPILRDHIIGAIKAGAGDFASVVDELIPVLQRMYRYYPEWEDMNMYDDLIYSARYVAFQWGITLRDVGRRVHIAVP